jgi:hypothetical protein
MAYRPISCMGHLQGRSSPSGHKKEGWFITSLEAGKLIEVIRTGQKAGGYDEKGELFDPFDKPPA